MYRQSCQNNSKIFKDEKKETVVTRACREVKGFDQMYQKLEQKVRLSGLSTATLKSYGRSIAHISLFFNQIPLDLSDEVINKYLAEIRSSSKYLFPRNAMRKVFKVKFCSELKQMTKRGDIQLPNELKEKLYAKKWVVYAKRPFLGPKAVIEFLGRYTHKVAISNYRIQALENGQVSFSWKDYKADGIKKLMTLSVIEFLRRFCLHLLPNRFQRIRHYGLLSSRGRSLYIPDLQLSMGIIRSNLTPQKRQEKVIDRLKISTKCPCCQKGNIRPMLPFGRDGPPEKSYIFEFLAKL